MADTNFSDGVTVVQASWLNDVNDAIYSALGSGGVAPTTPTEVATNIGAVTAGSIHAGSSVSTPDDADELPILDSTSTFSLKKITWANIKSTLKTYFDTLYQAAGSYVTTSDIGSTVQAYDADIPTVAASQAEMEAGTESALRAMSPLRIAQAISALGSAGTDQVARDQIALTNIRLMLNSAITTGALVQGRQWELSTDEWGTTSTNETYKALYSIGYYTNDPYSADQIPTMTGYTTPSGTVVYSADTASYEAWKAFNKSTGTWWTATGQTNWLGYDFGSGKIVKKYSLVAGNTVQSYAPKSWTFEGWNGSSWVVLDTQSNVSTWTANEYREFVIGNTTSYNKYRLNVTATAGATYTSIAEFSMHIAATAPDMTLMPDAAVSVTSAPAYMDAYFLWKDDSGSAVLGTDLTVELSRDGGTTYTTATLTNLASYDGTYSIVKARADVSSQPSGTAMLCGIKTLNNKAQRVAAPALYAE